MDYLITFLVGGGICVIGQILMDTTKLTAPRILVIFVVAGRGAAGSAAVRASRTGRPSGRRHAASRLWLRPCERSYGRCKRRIFRRNYRRSKSYRRRYRGSSQLWVYSGGTVQPQVAEMSEATRETNGARVAFSPTFSLRNRVIP